MISPLAKHLRKPRFTAHFDADATEEDDDEDEDDGHAEGGQ
jgi:hypothetical protein